MPLAARAQQPAMPVVAFLGTTTAEDFAPRVAAFHRGLREAGYTEGQNVAIEYRWPEGRYDRLPTLAADLVRRQVAVIAAGGPPAARAAKAATSTIPIVFTSGDDPVVAGLVPSFNRPGGNITGAAAINSELGGKRLSLLCDMVPQMTTVAFLSRTSTDAEAQNKQVLEAARALGLKLEALHARNETEIEMARYPCAKAC